MDTEFSHWHLGLSAFASVECFQSGHIKMKANKKELSAISSIRNIFTRLFYHTPERKVNDDFFSIEILNQAAQKMGYDYFYNVPDDDVQDMFDLAEDLSMEN
ncbi:hypothetical protein [Liquorilactobacillus satsumensis]|uniref:hypothetical protein n=1 Tax=Liquorilactobacillus satsumensis TaxID=259059 RepID=UPI00345DAC54